MIKYPKIYYGIVNPPGEPNDKVTTYFTKSQLEILPKKLIGKPLHINHCTEVGGKKITEAGKCLGGWVDEKTGALWAAIVPNLSAQGDLAKTLLGEKNTKQKMSEFSLGYDYVLQEKNGETIPTHNKLKEISIVFKGARDNTEIKGSEGLDNFLKSVYTNNNNKKLKKKEINNLLSLAEKNIKKMTEVKSTQKIERTSKYVDDKIHENNIKLLARKVQNNEIKTQQDYEFEKIAKTGFGPGSRELTTTQVVSATAGKSSSSKDKDGDISMKKGRKDDLLELLKKEYNIGNSKNKRSREEEENSDETLKPDKMEVVKDKFVVEDFKKYPIRSTGKPTDVESELELPEGLTDEQKKKIIEAYHKKQGKILNELNAQKKKQILKERDQLQKELGDDYIPKVVEAAEKLTQDDIKNVNQFIATLPERETPLTNSLKNYFVAQATASKTYNKKINQDAKQLEESFQKQREWELIAKKLREENENLKKEKQKMDTPLFKKPANSQTISATASRNYNNQEDDDMGTQSHNLLDGIDEMTKIHFQADRMDSGHRVGVERNLKNAKYISELFNTYGKGEINTVQDLGW